MLYYFHAPRAGDELTSLIRAGALLTCGLRLREADSEPGLRSRYADAYRRAIERLIEQTATQFRIKIGGDGTAPTGVELLTMLVDRVGDRSFCESLSAERRAELEQLLERCDRFLRGLAVVHGYQGAVCSPRPEQGRGQALGAISGYPRPAGWHRPSPLPAVRLLDPLGRRARPGSAEAGASW